MTTKADSKPHQQQPDKTPRHILWAKKLDKARYVYALYGALDGLSCNYSTYKYFFDVFLNHGSDASDMMHEWLVTPTGITSMVFSAAAFITLAALGNYFKDDDQKLIKKYIAILWPYARDTLKGLKNAYKGIRSTLQLADLLGLISSQNAHFLIVPFGLVLGVLSALNRMWLRRIKEQRMLMQSTNTNLLSELKNGTRLTPEEIAKYIELIQKQHLRQSLRTRKVALFCAAYGGSVDGLYLYMGALGICALTPPALLAMVIICTIYCLACIVNRVYEENGYQEKLTKSQIAVELALLVKSLDYFYGELQSLSESLALEQPLNADMLEKQREIWNQLRATFREFDNKRNAYNLLSRPTYGKAFLYGLQNGLYAYSAISSILFAISTILYLASIAFPPALLISFIALGLICLTGFITYSLIKMDPQQTNKTMELSSAPKLAELQQKYDTCKEAMRRLNPDVQLVVEDIKKAVNEVTSDPNPQFFFQQWFEDIRSLFSSIGKATKAVDYTCNALQEMDSDGHYHDTPIMFYLMAISSFFYAIGLTLRAHVRGFKNVKIETAEETLVEQTSNATPTERPEVAPEPESSRESGVARAPDSAPKKARLPSLFKFFSTCSGKHTSTATYSSMPACRQASYN